MGPIKAEINPTPNGRGQVEYNCLGDAAELDLQFLEVILLRESLNGGCDENLREAVKRELEKRKSATGIPASSVF